VDGHTQEVDAGHHPVKVLSRKTFPWRWKNSQGDIVDEKFVLSSLSVWASDPDSYVKRLAKEISIQTNVSLPDDSGLEEIAEKWIEKCIKKLFANPKWGQYNLDLIYEDRDFPDRRKIQLPRSILRDQYEMQKRNKDKQQGEIDRLETALLMAALSKNEFERRGIKRFLIVYPFSKKNKVDYFFAWLSSEEKVYAILIDPKLAESNFHNNVESATNIITDLFRSNSSIRQELNTNGIYFEESTPIIAIDFQNSMKKYSISEVR